MLVQLMLTQGKDVHTNPKRWVALYYCAANAGKGW